MIRTLFQPVFCFSGVVFLIGRLGTAAPSENRPAPPTPTGTPLQFTIHTIDDDGQERVLELHIEGDVSGDVEAFRRQQEAAREAARQKARAGVKAALSRSDEITTGHVERGDFPSTFPMAQSPADRNAEWLYRSAQARFREGDRAAGRALLFRVLSAAPESRWAGEAHVALGRQAEYARSYEEALEHLHHPSVALTDPDRQAQAALAAADALAMLDRFDAARESARRALGLAEEPKRQLDAQRAVERTAILGRPAPPIEVDAVLEAKDRTNFKPVKETESGSETDERLICTPVPGRIAWLEFFSADCPYCKKAYPSQVALANRLLDLGMDVYWIGIGESETDTKEQARAHLEDHLEQYPRPGVVATDADLKTTFAAFEGQGTPWTVLIDESGTVRYADTYNEQGVRDKLTRMLGGDVLAD